MNKPHQINEDSYSNDKSDEQDEDDEDEEFQQQKQSSDSLNNPSQNFSGKNNRNQVDSEEKNSLNSNEYHQNMPRRTQHYNYNLKGNNTQQQAEEQLKKEKKRNEFWKFRYNPMNKKEKHVPQQETNNDTIQHYIPPKVNFKSEEEFVTVSIAKAKEFNNRLIGQKQRVKELLKKQERDQNYRKQLDPNTNMSFPVDVPILLWDEEGNQYFTDQMMQQPKELKGTLEDFINLNVQNEHSLMYLNELSKQGGYYSRLFMHKRKRRKRRKHLRISDYQQDQDQND